MFLLPYITYQESYGGEADVEFLVLQAEPSGHLHTDLQAGRRHDRQEVRYNQLQALEGHADQILSAI